MTIDWVGIEAKWREKWDESKEFEIEPNEKEKKFVTVAYPYPNSPQHIGHGRTYTLADVHSRYLRMKGYNVLFPMGFHYTGTPILGMAKRVENNDSELIEGLKKLYDVPEGKIREFIDPVRIADYFHEEIKAGMIEMGYSIDWRREFTTIDRGYQKFIEWQIGKLKENNLIIQGSHPVGWCPNDQNPVSQHDTQGDVEPDFTEYILIKFRLGEEIIPTATLRPETIFGVTNLWINPETSYKRIEVNGEKWITSSECAYKLSFQNKDVQVIEEIRGSELVGKKVSFPNRDDVIILPASFVQSYTGTGIVMSVPAHAPYDYQALKDLKADSNEKVRKETEGIDPIPIIHTQGFGEIPSEEIIEKFGITNQLDPKLEDATKELYNKEFYEGSLKENTFQFYNKKVSEVKDQIKDWLEQRGNSDKLLEMTNSPVRCRCGTECVVKILNNQWFLDYGNKSWKEKAVKCFEKMGILPPEISSEFNYVVGWLKERACARQQGLGTKLPWDKDWIVESLSDSVIYMAYYIISRYVNDKLIFAENLSDQFFDYVFLGIGDSKSVSESTKIDQKTIDQIRSDFRYFYPVDSRHSGRDLVPNHLAFFVMNHVAIFPEDLWPKEIVVNGSVLMEGKKMSKSMGNIIPLRKAIREFGADPIRLAIVISAELLQDADFNMDSVNSIKNKLESLMYECKKYQRVEINNLEPEDSWILTKLQALVRDTTESIERMRLREALHHVLFEFESSLHWYQKRTSAKKRENIDGILHKILSTRVVILSPFAPHIAEEMWEKLGNTGFASQTKWPSYEGDNFDLSSIQSEELLKSIIDDISNILNVTKMTPSKIIIYTADDFKTKTYHAILEAIVNGQTNMGQIMKELIANPETQEVKKNPDFVQKTIKDVLSEPMTLRNSKLRIQNFDEKNLIKNELTSLVKNDFGVEITVYSESDPEIYDPKNKAHTARPFKPAILIE